MRFYMKQVKMGGMLQVRVGTPVYFTISKDRIYPIRPARIFERVKGMPLYHFKTVLRYPQTAAQYRYPAARMLCR